jgi:hypothetical protein
MRHEEVPVTTLTDRTPTSPSAALSLVDLRRHLLRQASTLSVRARTLRQRGDSVQAQRLAEESARLLRVAREMGQRDRR